MKTLRFLAVEGDHSFSPARARIGQMPPIGKTRAEDGTFSIDSEPASVTVSGDHEAEDITFLRKEVKQGRLVIADAATAKALDLPHDGAKAFGAPPPFVPDPESPALSDRPRPLPAPHVETLSPPSFESDPLSALSKRKEK